MEAGFLNFHDEEHFSDFSLTIEQNLRERPQDLLMQMVENDFEYIEPPLDIVSSDSLWSNEQEHESIEAVANSLLPKIDLKEDFAKVLTDWQEHIGYLQASDMEEYMDIVGINMNLCDKKSFFENIPQDESASHIPDLNLSIKMEQEELKEDIEINQNTLKPHLTNSNTDNIKEEIDIKEELDFKGFPPADTNSNCIQSTINVNKAQNGKSKIKKIHKTEVKENQNSACVSAVQKKRKRNVINERKQIKLEAEIDDCIDVETISDELPVLEAGDVKSLLEQFEASEKSVIPPMQSKKAKKESNQSIQTRSNRSWNQSQLPLSKKPANATTNKNICDTLPKEVIDRIKASRQKKAISVIPAMPNTQGNRNGTTRLREAPATFSRKKLSKAVNNNNKRPNGELVQLDHDYCSSSTNSTVTSVDTNRECEKSSSQSEKIVTKNLSEHPNSCSAFNKQSTSYSSQYKNSVKKEENRTDTNTKKDSSLETKTINNVNKEPMSVVNNSNVNGTRKEIFTENGECQKETSKQPLSMQNSTSVSPSTSNDSKVPAYEMKIRSALATSILRNNNALNQTNSVKTNGRMKQMVSVLKPLNVQQPPALTNNPNESIVTTTNSSNNEVQNIIVQSVPEIHSQEETKKPRKKLNLAEYRSRREQNRSDSSRTNSPIQPMVLVYVHHASTTTEPIENDPQNLMSEREIVSVLKPKTEIEDAKTKPRPTMRDVGIQTYETVFEFPTKSLVDVDERKEESRSNQIKDRKERSYRKRRDTPSSSRSRSRSKSRNRNRSRSRSKSKNRSNSRSKSRERNRGRNKSKSRSRSRSRSSSRSHSRSSSRSSTRSRSRSRNRSRSHNRRSRTYSRSRSRSRSRSQRRGTRRRRLSHRRYSVSSSSSWSSRSRSHTRSTSTSRSRYSSSRSRSFRSRTRSSSRYSSCSRSPSNAYRRPYDNWYDREKQRQVEERRVIYVGRLEEGITKADLRRRFEIFGPVVDISVHFREHGDNYGFVTFAYKNDAYEAVEHGNDDPSLPRYDLCFGGRRAFCKVKYADLDGMASNSSSGGIPSINQDNTFDLLLKEAKAKLRKRKV